MRSPRLVLGILLLGTVAAPFGLARASDPAGGGGRLRETCDAFAYGVHFRDLLPADRDAICAENECREGPPARAVAEYLRRPPMEQAGYRAFAADPSIARRENPWRMSKIPSLAYREIGIARILANSLGMLGVPATGSLAEIRASLARAYSRELFAERPEARLPARRTPRELRRWLTRYVEDRNHETEIEYSLPMLVAACAVFSPLETAGCSANLARLARLFNSGDTPSVASPYFADILTSDAPARGARAAAETVARKYLEARVGGSLSEDVRAAFLSEGYGERAAERWTWDLILLAFVHGQNGYALANEALAPYNAWVLSAAMTISSVGVYLDTLNRQASGRPYTTPAGVDAGCDNGKPYHFWVPAYAARDSLRRGFSPGAARLAPYLMETGYQMLSRSTGRDPDAHLRAGKDSDRMALVRLDLAYAAAGVRFATRKDGRASVDRAFDRSYAVSRDPENPALKTGSAAWARAWFGMMEPKTALRTAKPD